MKSVKCYDGSIFVDFESTSWQGTWPTTNEEGQRSCALTAVRRKLLKSCMCPDTFHLQGKLSLLQLIFTTD